MYFSIGRGRGKRGQEKMTAGGEKETEKKIHEKEVPKKEEPAGLCFKGKTGNQVFITNCWSTIKMESVKAGGLREGDCRGKEEENGKSERTAKTPKEIGIEKG